MLTVSAAASVTDLTTTQAVKDDLSISGSSEDTYIGNQIDRVSALICSYLGVAIADDGTCTLGRETLVETVRLNEERDCLTLARYPVTSITSVVEDGTTLESDEYEVEKATGFLYRLDGDDNRTVWPSVKIVVTYVAGWKLPGEASRNLPHDIEAAALALVKAERAARTRDPLVKSESIPDVLTTSYWVGGVGDGGAMAPDIAAKLDPYRNMVR